MQPLFTTQSVYTYEEYKRFNFAIMNFRQTLPILAVDIVLLVLMTITTSVMRTTYGYFYPVVRFFFFLAVALFVSYIFVLLAALLGIKKTYESNKAMKRNPVSTVYFYNEYLTETNSKGVVNIAYADIYKIVETKTNFYIMLAKNNGIIIVKQNCTPELIIFLQNLKNTIV